MALCFRFVPNVGRAALVANGRNYLVTGATVDVPYADGLAIQGDQALRLTLVGATTDRPTFQPGVPFGGMPMTMYDTSLGGPIFLSNPGVNPPLWVNISGSPV